MIFTFQTPEVKSILGITSKLEINSRPGFRSMLDIILIGISLVLVGVAGLQFSYMFYLDRLHRDRKHHVRHLERRNARLAAKLEAAEQQIAEQTALLEKVCPEYVSDEEAWAEIIEEN